MGVPTFYKWLSVKYARVVTDAIEGTPLTDLVDSSGEAVPAAPPNGHFDNLYLDMNGIIHPCSHPEDGAAPSTEDEMFLRIFAYVDRIVNVVQPQKLLYLAIDGVAPRAKMNQQRTRRFKAAAEVAQETASYEELRKQFESEGRSVPARTVHWDSNVITPGTPFLSRLSTALHYYINDRMATVPSWKNLKVVLSDANCPGEGEHKIMHYIRAQRTYESYNPNLRHCLHGADADLIMLGLATHEPYFYILREAVLEQADLKKCYLCGKSDHLASDCPCDPETIPSASAVDYKSSWKPLQFLSIPILREYLAHEFAFADAPNFTPDLERCLDDFVMMCFFVGNDFLPHLPSLSIHKGSIDQMLLLYQKVRPTFSDYLTNAGELNLPQLQAFVQFLGSVEEQVFIEELKRQDRMNQRKKDADSRSVTPSTDTMSSQRGTDDASDATVAHQWKRTFAEGVTPPSPQKRPRLYPAKDVTGNNGTSNPHEQDIDQFKALLRAKRKADTEIENPVDEIKLGVGNDWKLRYYHKKFNMTTTDPSDVEPFIKQVASSYTEGLRWVLAYYYQGVCSWDWFYPYHYAPFASDIAAYGMQDQKPFSLGKPFRPFHQLMAVLPPQSGHCLPQQFARLMTDPDSPILDFYPLEFKEDPDGKRYKWQWVVLLPFIDQERLLRTAEPLESLLTQDEQHRNCEGHDRLFVSKYSPLAPQLSLVQLGTSQQEVTQTLNSETSDKVAGEVFKCPTGLVTGVQITAPKCSTQLFPSKESVVVSCHFRCLPLKRHLCQLLTGAILPTPTLTAANFQDDVNDSRNRRFNAQAAKRMIMGSLARQRLVSQAEADKYFWGSRSNRGPRGGPYSNNGPSHDNRYQQEMFGHRNPSYTSARPPQFHSGSAAAQPGTARDFTGHPQNQFHPRSRASSFGTHGRVPSMPSAHRAPMNGVPQLPVPYQQVEAFTGVTSSVSVTQYPTTAVSSHHTRRPPVSIMQRDARTQNSVQPQQTFYASSDHYHHHYNHHYHHHQEYQDHQGAPADRRRAHVRAPHVRDDRRLASRGHTAQSSAHSYQQTFPQHPAAAPPNNAYMADAYDVSGTWQQNVGVSGQSRPQGRQWETPEVQDSSTPYHVNANSKQFASVWQGNVSENATSLLGNAARPNALPQATMGSPRAAPPWKQSAAYPTKVQQRTGTEPGSGTPADSHRFPRPPGRGRGRY